MLDVSSLSVCEFSQMNSVQLLPGRHLNAPRAFFLEFRGGFLELSIPLCKPNPVNFKAHESIIS